MSIHGFIGFTGFSGFIADFIGPIQRCALTTERRSLNLYVPHSILALRVGIKVCRLFRAIPLVAFITVPNIRQEGHVKILLTSNRITKEVVKMCTYFAIAGLTINEVTDLGLQVAIRESKKESLWSIRILAPERQTCRCIGAI